MKTPPDNLQGLSPLKRALLAMEEMQAKLEAVESLRTAPIAIVGVGCRFPRAEGPDGYWNLLSQGVDAISEIPADRFNLADWYDPDPEAPGKMTTRWAGFMDRVDLFDADFFGISPREAIHMEPQQRILLEVAWEALEHAGMAPDRVGARGPVGVFIGICINDYGRLLQAPERIDAWMGTGNAFSVAAGRISYLLGFEGPSIAIDTACSSSLVGVHLACQSLRSEECRMALAGGANVILAPEIMINFSKSRMLAPDGRCKTFDAAADGYVRGEGCGIVVLKRLSDALADGDRILGVIRGSAVNQDGRSNGLTAPNGPAQEAVIRKALADGGLQPDDLDYVEAHGTGTLLGDPVEVNALGRVLGVTRQKPMLLGSVKTNFGHLEAAAGIAGLIKLVLALEHEEIPRHLHLKRKNNFIAWDQFRIDVPTRNQPWKRGERRRVGGVSSFGFSGTNAHIVIEEAPLSPKIVEPRDRPVHLLTVSAKSQSALKELAQRYAAELPDGGRLADMAYTANTGRARFGHRVAVVAETVAEACDRLKAFAVGASDGPAAGQVRPSQRPKIAFLFTGQGSQYVGMGQQLYETESVFRRTLDHCDEALRGVLAQPLLSVLYPEDPRASPLDRTEYTQPALFALEYALAELWKSWGIVPGAVMGHSVGEYVAACIAGVFSLEDGLTLIAKRAALMQALPAGGQMAAVLAEPARVERAIRNHTDRVSIAALNGPAQVVISGDGQAIETILEQLGREGIRAQKLTVSHAFHSPLMEPMLDEFERFVAGIKLNSPHITLISNLTGNPVSREEIVRPDYWRRHVSAAVQFTRSIETLHAQGFDTFLEIGPSPVLLGMGRPSLPENTALWLPSLKQGRGEWRQMMDSVALLFVAGAEVDWDGFDRGYPRNKVSLPTYAFQRERYWVDREDQGRRSEFRRGSGQEVHPLLGERLRSALRDVLYECAIDLQKTEIPDRSPGLWAARASGGGLSGDGAGCRHGCPRRRA